ncbi:MAG: helix-turn-helix domain-containing protein [Bryobacterales bacterium]|nr:helix-turn-helix domain-containing protein [Bryobacterales bacterium]
MREIDAQTAMEQRIGFRLSSLREQRGWTLDDLAERTQISRATLSRIERGELSPTARMLGALCSIYGWTLSRLMTDAESNAGELVRLPLQIEWKDVDTGYWRRAISPPAPGLRGEMVEVKLPPGCVVSYDAAPVIGLEHHLWMMQGRLRLTVGGTDFELEPGDCLRYVLKGSSRFEGLGEETVHYVIAMVNP